MSARGPRPAAVCLAACPASRYRPRGPQPGGVVADNGLDRRPAEYTRTTGYDTLAVLVREDPSVDAGWLRAVVATIEAEVCSSANRARHAMNMALIAIGGHRPELRDAVVAAAGRIGKIKVDHGDTACVTPDILPSIEKMAARAG